MSYCGDGVVKNHTWPRPPHNGAYLLTHIGLVAVYCATLARRLPLSIFATIESLMSICHKLAVLLRDLGNPQLVATI